MKKLYKINEYWIYKNNDITATVKVISILNQPGLFDNLNKQHVIFKYIIKNKDQIIAEGLSNSRRRCIDSILKPILLTYPNIRFEKIKFIRGQIQEEISCVG